MNPTPGAGLENGWLHHDAAAQALGITPAALHALRRDGKAPRHRQKHKRGIVTYHLDDLRAWLQANPRKTLGRRGPYKRRDTPNDQPKRAAP